MSSQNIVIRLIRQQILNTNNNAQDEEDPETALLNRLISLTENRSFRNSTTSNAEPMNEEDFLRRIQQFMPHRDLDTIRSVINRLGNNTRTFQDNLINHFNRRSEQLQSEEPNNIRYYREDDIAESFDELLMEEESSENQDFIVKINSKKMNLVSNEYIDYKLYPCPINWDQINDNKTMAYETMEKFGYFGCYIYINLAFSDFKVKYFKLDSELLFLVNKILNDNNYFNQFEKLIKCLPSLTQVEKIIKELLIREKELILIKIVLDLHEIYLRFVSKKPFIKLTDEYSLFYNVAFTFIKFLKSSVLASSKEFKPSNFSLISQIKSRSALVSGYNDLKKKFKTNFLTQIETYRKRIVKLKAQHEIQIMSFSENNFIV